MTREGDVTRARADFLAGGNNNLQALIRQRCEWMNDFINNEDIVVELGCGAGLTSFFLRRGQLFATDLRSYHWVSACVDATCLPFKPGAVDVFICVNMIHHLAAPVKFLEDLQACLSPGGYILIHEPNPSWLMLAILRLMNHEGWSLDVDVFDPDAVANDPSDPWSGNNAISRLIFSDCRFATRFPLLRVVREHFSECLLFPVSGGVTAKIPTVRLPKVLLNLIIRFDKVLCLLAPYGLALGRSIAIQKVA